MPDDLKPETSSVPFDAHLIPEDNGSTDVMEWITRAEMFCQLRGVAIESVLPLRLTGGAFSVLSQLRDASRHSMAAVKEALYVAFALNQYGSHEIFAEHCLQPDQSVDVFVADLRRLSALLGGVSGRTLACAFVVGLPDDVRHAVCAGLRAEGLDLHSVLVRACVVLTDECVAAAGISTSREQSSASARDRWQTQAPGGLRRVRRCWTCGKPGHFAAACSQQGSDVGGASSAPVAPQGS